MDFTLLQLTLLEGELHKIAIRPFYKHQSGKIRRLRFESSLALFQVKLEAVRGVLQTFPLQTSDVTNGREVQINTT